MPDDNVIHVVDDDVPFREGLRALLEGAGFSVVEYGDGHSFVEGAAAAVGCALIDVNMPDQSGIALQEELGRRGVKIPVIIMTGDADVPMAVRAMKAGAVDFIEKPIDMADLRAAIERALTRRDSAEQEDPAVTAIKARIPGLTAREREILEAVVGGHPTKIIAHKLGISPRTVHVHRLHIGEKLGVTGLSNLVRLALAAGVTPLGLPS